MLGNKFKSVVLTTMLSISLITLMVGCEQGEQSTDSIENQADLNQLKEDELLLGRVAEFDGYKLRANVSPTEFLPDAMLREHDIEAGPHLIQLNVVILEKRPDNQLVPVSAEVNAHYENRGGNVEVLDMQAFKADGLISYMSTLDASAQHSFRFFIEAQPEDNDQPLQMHFEVQLPNPDSD